ncbi:MAG: hypothetical protein U5L45_25565 [Saprospiraceae bacterium]|nr:hypothetical protein [Saprospiraceae bacterium]
MSGLAARAGRAGRFLWSGWAGMAGLALVAAAWQAAHEAPCAFNAARTPLDTLRAAARLLADPGHRADALDTLARALQGFALAGGAKAAAGLACGHSAAAMRAARPVLTFVIGVPPIAWIRPRADLAGDRRADRHRHRLDRQAAPILFAAGPRARRRATAASMTWRASSARTPRSASPRWGCGRRRRILFPAAVLALGTAVKVAVMAELLTSAGGVGGALATARANLDVAEAVAWVLIAVGGLDRGRGAADRPAARRGRALARGRPALGREGAMRKAGPRRAGALDHRQWLRPFLGGCQTVRYRAQPPMRQPGCIHAQPRTPHAPHRPPRRRACSLRPHRPAGALAPHTRSPSPPRLGPWSRSTPSRWRARPPAGGRGRG